MSDKVKVKIEVAKSKKKLFSSKSEYNRPENKALGAAQDGSKLPVRGVTIASNFETLSHHLRLVFLFLYSSSSSSCLRILYIAFCIFFSLSLLLPLDFNSFLKSYFLLSLLRFGSTSYVLARAWCRDYNRVVANVPQNSRASWKSTEYKTHWCCL